MHFNIFKMCPKVETTVALHPEVNMDEKRNEQLRRELDN